MLIAICHFDFRVIISKMPSTANMYVLYHVVIEKWDNFFKKGIFDRTLVQTLNI